MAFILKSTDHSRDIAGLKYVYPVLSRRAGGLSVGINFNINNACNWRCIYCQVPGLKTGAAPEMDFELLETELRHFLGTIQDGSFYRQFQVPENARFIKDIAISGNGEPTSLASFAEAVDLIGRIATELRLFPDSRYVLITNGSLMHRSGVQEGLSILHRYDGEVWFKLDSATEAGRRLINRAGQSFRASLKNILLSSSLCRTKLQICLLDIDRQGYPEQERQALLNALKTIKAQSSLRHVMLYTIARPSLQPEAHRLSKLPMATMEAMADDIRALGFSVQVDG